MDSIRATSISWCGDQMIALESGSAARSYTASHHPQLLTGFIQSRCIYITATYRVMQNAMEDIIFISGNFKTANLVSPRAAPFIKKCALHEKFLWMICVSG